MNELAIQAQTDADARQVLRDAVLESGWWDARVANMCCGHTHGRKNMRLFGRLCDLAGMRWARAVLAVLLFEGMSTTRWPGVESSKLPPMPLAEMGRVMRRLWPQSRLPEMLYQQMPFLGMIRRQA